MFYFSKVESNVQLNQMFVSRYGFFLKLFYVSVLFTCKQHRLWQVERTLGAVLKDGYSNLYNQMVLRRSECYEKCLLASKRLKRIITYIILLQMGQKSGYTLVTFDRDRKLKFGVV